MTAESGTNDGRGATARTASLLQAILVVDSKHPTHQYSSASPVAGPVLLPRRRGLRQAQLAIIDMTDVLEPRLHQISMWQVATYLCRGDAWRCEGSHETRSSSAASLLLGLRDPQQGRQARPELGATRASRMLGIGRVQGRGPSDGTGACRSTSSAIQQQSDPRCRRPRGLGPSPPGDRVKPKSTFPRTFCRAGAGLDTT